MLCLRVKAPFAAFRTFTAGSYRPTAPFITPSAAYGLVLNIAGIESRYDDGHAPMTLTNPGLARVEIALGAITFPEVQSIYQQLHNYPVGAMGKGRAKDCKGAKYNIQPVRREFLSGLDAYICIRENDSLEEHVRAGLRGGGPEGLPRVTLATVFHSSATTALRLTSFGRSHHPGRPTGTCDSLTMTLVLWRGAAA